MHAIAILVLAVLPVLDGERPALRPLETPAAARSHHPDLIAGADGKLYLTWVEPAEPSHLQLRFSVETGTGWSAPRTIARGGDWLVDWADHPSMAALADGTLAAHWLARAGNGTLASGVHVSLSGDGGKTWSAPVSPHRDTAPTEHGFVSMVPIDAGSFRLVWSDGRVESAGEVPTEDGRTALRSTTLGRDGALGEDRAIDLRTSPGCRTSAVQVGNTLVAAYRDRSDEGVRDIAIARIGPDGGADLHAVHEDGWRTDRDPSDGPAIAARGDDVGVAWFTGAGGRSRVLFARSTDGGKTFGAPVTIDDGNSAGRVDLTTHPVSGWLAVYLERGDLRGEVRLRSIAADGTPGASLVVARTAIERGTGFPRIERVGDRVIIAWTELVEAPGNEGAAPSGIRTAQLVYPPRDEDEGS